jgi:hypothetical protein
MAVDLAERAAVEKTFLRWLKDGKSWIGIFENQDLGHPEGGRRVALQYDESQWDKAERGSGHAPDHATYGFGWRYLLVAKCRTADAALKEMGY